MTAPDIRSIEVLTPVECARVHESVLGLRDHWCQPYPDFEFFTLGAASYLDATKSGDQSYKRKARRDNQVLKRHFGWLLEKVCAALNGALDSEVFFDEAMALPGFHIIPMDQDFSKEVHADLQYENIVFDPKHGTIDFERQLSTTLAIVIPPGAGLDYWDSMADVTRVPAKHLSYRSGWMALHPGCEPHRIAMGKGAGPGRERITLQAHAAPGSKGWLLYW